ncbi:MAG: outer membrane protein transport protein [Bacteroidales bacterium]|nr:outer membrane protein transport protein [Bacteroidales bacterium]
MPATRNILRILYFVIFIQFTPGLHAQLLNHYWSQSYNSISSLLSGAVVGGDAGPSAIYYNPALINEFANGTNVSLAASFLTLNHYSFYNAVSEGEHIPVTNFYVQPQFFSMTFVSPNHKLSFEVATFTRIRQRFNATYAKTSYNDMSPVPVVNKFTSTYNYVNDYDDSWIGIGGSYSISEKFSVGLSLLFSSSTLNYYNALDATRYPMIDTLAGLPDDFPILVAENNYSERIKFTNIRLVSKIGLSYKSGNWSYGLNITLPPLNIFTSGRHAERMQKEFYSSNGEEPLYSYFIFDTQEGTEIKANYKLPFSLALGTIYNFENRKQRFYTTIEYFARVKPYKMITATVNDQITSKPIYDRLDNKEWLSFAYGANPVLNIALGYQWQFREDLLIMMGLRTDFNNVNNLDLKELSSYNKIKTTDFNIYHATGGIQFHFKRHLLVAGTQFSFGYKNNQLQIADFTDVDQIDPDSPLPLFGERKYIMDSYYYSISVFLGATLNFEKKEKIPGK